MEGRRGGGEGEVWSNLKEGRGEWKQVAQIARHVNIGITEQLMILLLHVISIILLCKKQEEPDYFLLFQ